jgi:hypothetical protein
MTMRRGVGGLAALTLVVGGLATPAGAQGDDAAAPDSALVVGLLAATELDEAPGLGAAAPYAVDEPTPLAEGDELAPLCGETPGVVRAGVEADVNGSEVSGFQVVATVAGAKAMLAEARRTVKGCDGPHVVGDLTIVPAGTQPKLESRDAVAFVGTIEGSGNVVSQLLVRSGRRLLSYFVIVAPAEIAAVDATDLDRLADLASRHLDAATRATKPPRREQLSRRALAGQDYEEPLRATAELGPLPPLDVQAVTKAGDVRRAGVPTTVWGEPFPAYRDIAGGAVAYDPTDPGQLSQLVVGMPGDRAAEAIEAAAELAERTEPFEDETGATITPVDPPADVVQAAPDDAVVLAGEVARPGEPIATSVRVLYRNGQFLGDVASTGSLAAVATSLSVKAVDLLAQQAALEEALSAAEVVGRDAAAVYTGQGNFTLCVGPAGGCVAAVTTQQPRVTLRLERDGAATATYTVRDTDITIDPSCTSPTLSGEGEVVLAGEAVTDGYLRGQFLGYFDASTASASHFFVGTSSGQCGWEFQASLRFTAYRV